MTEFIITLFRDFLIAFVVGFGWAILFGSPKKILYIAGLLGGLGHSIRFLLISQDIGLITATFIGATTIGIVGIFIAHKVDHPPVVFTMPACITMIPGMYAYQTMLAGIKTTEVNFYIANPTIEAEMIHNFMLTVSLLFTLAIGISIGVLLFRKESNRYISIKKIIKSKKNI